MKYLSIPAHLLKFWYPESLVIFLRVWKNSLLFLEEDMAVGLMLKLLFVPLFHDATFVGRGLSFCFRFVRISLGLFAFVLVSLLILFLSLFWFGLPALAFLLTGLWGLAAKVLLSSGIALFIIHLLSHPPKKVWQIKNPKEIWQASFLKRKNLDFAKLLKTDSVGSFLLYLEKKPQDFSHLKPVFTEEELLEKIWEQTRKLKIPYLKPEHFFVGLLSLIPNIENELMKLNLVLEDFLDALDFLKKREDQWRLVPIWDEDFRVRRLKGVNRGWLGTPTPSLDAVSDDLTYLATRANIPDFVGRSEVIAQLLNILSLQQGRNVILVGEVGSGRGALVGYLAKLIISGDAPASLATKRIVGLDFTRLLSGIKTQGELAERLENIFEEVKFCGNIVIFVDEVQNLGVGEAGQEFNLYSLMLPFIESSTTQIITTTESGSYNRVIEKNSSFARLFTKIELPPATPFETVDILKNRAIETERYKKIKTSLLAIKAIANLSFEYIHDRVLPDSALHVFEQCQPKALNGWISQRVVEEIVQTFVKIPVGEAGAEKREEVLNLENIIHQRLIDQEEAVKKVSDALRRAAAKLTDTKRPIGSFLFVGPTGVGKTELAKILSEEYFSGQGNFARFDMSEYQNPDSLNKLIGAKGESGHLTETVKTAPYILLLLDEFEKADPKILTLFLQVLEDGRLTDGTGKLIDFTNTIIIATSNAASLTIAQELGKNRTLKEIEETVRNELLQIFKPELLNRFDGVILFKPLSGEDLQKIVKLKLADLQNRLKEQGYLVEFEESLIQKLTEKGYDPVMGARPLRRLIQDTLEAKLSALILENKLPKGEKFVASEQLLN